MPEPTVTVSRFEVSCLSRDHPEASSFTLVVELQGDGRWRVGRGHASLGADGTMSLGYSGPLSDREPVTDEDRAALRAAHQAWLDTHRFTRSEALRLARQAAPLMTIGGRWTVADVLADLD